ncbi:MAG TPA: hypothetical protein VJ836_04420 [Candidatus Saccharimonadales bacterium]|nr:hypothetical protein [Candidatus Saccharimonadales bacterium]
MVIAQTSNATMSAVQHGMLTARRIDDDMSWAEGTIRPLHNSLESERELIEAVLECVESVPQNEKTYSSCTDGRLPVRLLSGEAVPVREQMVGADTVSAFYVAECLGARFYKDPAAPVARRVLEVAEFLQESGIMPSTHIGCGAAAGFVIIIENTVRFSRETRYLARLRALLPERTYDEKLHATILAQNEARLQKGVYQALSAQTFLDVVERVSGKRAIAELKDDNRGVHGHVEEAIVRVRVPGKAINEAKVAAVTNGREVFGVNDERMEQIARLFSRGSDDDYTTARIALEDFASSGHATLSKHLPTYIISEP